MPATDDVPEIARMAAYALGIGCFLTMRRRGFWPAAAAALVAAAGLMLLAYAVLAWGPPAIFALAMLYLGLFAILQILPLLAILAVLHGALLWWARRRAA
ncbi:hypothetical protein DFH01_02025 [Falsiroseomonas bella]|uniref:Uncharacterized protein n=1 Tax=Falsiroseomonas bella TaxID=2184016 RepID=A0A317FHM9_9PROT|nr:hypothetical protein [Falsiroseomonas bella]PWS38103.1 hypothetical protein DFH01_02025 [Falsiroseomonas bella]